MVVEEMLGTVKKTGLLSELFPMALQATTVTSYSSPGLRLNSFKGSAVWFSIPRSSFSTLATVSAGFLQREEDHKIHLGK